MFNSSTTNPEHEGDSLEVPTGAVETMLLHVMLL